MAFSTKDGVGEKRAGPFVGGEDEESLSSFLAENLQLSERVGMGLEEEIFLIF